MVLKFKAKLNLKFMLSRPWKGLDPLTLRNNKNYRLKVEK